MRKTIVALVCLCAALLVIGCEDNKKTTEATPSTPAAAPVAVMPLPPPPKPTPAEVIPKTIATAVDAWNAHDPVKVAANYQTTATLTIPGLPDIEGRDAISTHAKDTFTAYPDFKVAVTKNFIHGSTAAFEWVITGKNDGPAMGQKPSGRRIGVAGASVVTVDDDGLIKEEHRYVDLPTIMSQLDPKAKAGTFRAPLALPTAPTETRVATETPNDAKTIDAAKTIYAAFDSKSEASLLAVVTDHTVVDDRMMSTIFTGTKGATDYANGFWKAFPDFKQTYPVRFAAGDIVITEGVLNGTQSGPMGPIKATNKPVTVRFVDVLQIKDGKIARLDSFGDSAEILQAAGAINTIAHHSDGAHRAIPRRTLGDLLNDLPWLTLASLGCAALAAVILVRFLVSRPPLTGHEKGWLLLGLGVFPIGAALFGNVQGYEATKQRYFCASCHVMTPWTSDSDNTLSTSLSSRHGRNKLFGAENCYTCHEDYGMFGTVMTKIGGLNHVWMRYTKYRNVSAEAGEKTIRLNKPFPNNNCMQCHSTTDTLWLEIPYHRLGLEALRADKMSCAYGACHGFAHPNVRPTNSAAGL